MPVCVCVCVCVCVGACVHHKVVAGKEKSEQESKERLWIWKAGVEEKMPCTKRRGLLWATG